MDLRQQLEKIDEQFAAGLMTPDEAWCEKVSCVRLALVEVDVAEIIRAVQADRPE